MCGCVWVCVCVCVCVCRDVNLGHCVMHFTRMHTHTHTHTLICSLTHQMNKESQLWPSFTVSSKPTDHHRRQSPHPSNPQDTSLPYEEEMSGMFTLKRKKDKAGAVVEGELSRSSSVSSHSQRSSSSSGGGHRRRSQSIDPGLGNRTSLSSRGNGTPSHTHN